MITMSYLCGFGGVVSGIALMVHTSAPGCSGWVGCGTDHTLVGHGIACLALGIIFSALFSGLGSIARTLGEIQAGRGNTARQLETPPVS
jgi:hypothetical protein